MMASRRIGRLVFGAAMVAMVAPACGKRVLEPGGGGMGRIEAGVLGGAGWRSSAAGGGGGSGIAGAAGVGGQPPPGPPRYLGAACSFARRLPERLLRRRRLLQHRVHGALSELQPGGGRRDLRRDSRGGHTEDSHRLSRPAGVDVWPGRHVRRRRQLPPPCRRNAVRARDVCGHDRRRIARRATGTAPAGPARPSSACPSPAIPRRARASASCTSDAQCVGRPCVDGSCFRPPTGRCQSNSQCVSGFCVVRRLLQRRLRGPVYGLQPAQPRGDVLAAARLPRAGRGVGLKPRERLAIPAPPR